MKNYSEGAETPNETEQGLRSREGFVWNRRQLPTNARPVPFTQSWIGLMRTTHLQAETNDFSRIGLQMNPLRSN
jgi:hypothetical protein